MTIKHGKYSSYTNRACRCDECRAAARAHNASYWREYYPRLKRGEITLPELDWAICARGGTDAQAKAHRRRGERPCAACLRAETAAARQRLTKRREAAAS